MGQDGATHHGIFDLAYLNCIPDMIIAAPMDAIELRNMMYTAQLGLDIAYCNTISTWSWEAVRLEKAF